MSGDNPLIAERIIEGVTLDRWFARGRALGFGPDGDSFLVELGVPGERVDVILRERRYGRVATVTRVREASPARVATACPHAAVCTGCALLHVTPDEEARYKQVTVSEVLARYAHVVWPVDRVRSLGSAERGGHRVRARFLVQEGRLGLRSRRGELVHIPGCPANSDAVRTVYETLVTDPIWEDVAAVADAVSVVEGRDGLALVLETPPHVDADAIVERIAERLPWLSAVGVDQGGGPRPVVGSWPRQHTVAGVTLVEGVDGWTQPTPSRAEAVYTWVREVAQARGARVLDGTCGTGGMSLMLAAEAREVVGVDVHYGAVQSARASAEVLGAHNVHFRGGKLATVAPRMVSQGERFDVALINPMRRPVGETAMRAVAELGVDRVIYLAPSPTSGAKDLHVLLGQGFEIAEVTAANLHPGTGAVMMGVLALRTDRNGAIRV